MTIQDMHLRMAAAIKAELVADSNASGLVNAPHISEERLAAIIEAYSTTFPDDSAMKSSGFTQMHFETARDVSDLEEAAYRTEPDYAPTFLRMANPDVVRLLHAAMGMVTESAELLDMLKCHLYYGKPLDLVNAMEEIGDTSWYQRIGAAVCKSTLVVAIMTNVRKLKVRYPDRFTEDKALNRNLAAERSALENNEGVLEEGHNGGQ